MALNRKMVPRDSHLGAGADICLESDPLNDEGADLRGKGLNRLRMVAPRRCC